jgi:cobalt transporter subunit CbtB
MQPNATLSTQVSARPTTSPQSERLTAAIFAALLGLIVIWGVGFSQVSVLHNAAHDVRHSNGFPCH